MLKHNTQYTVSVQLVLSYIMLAHYLLHILNTERLTDLLKVIRL